MTKTKTHSSRKSISQEHEARERSSTEMHVSDSSNMNVQDEQSTGEHTTTPLAKLQYHSFRLKTIQPNERASKQARIQIR